MIIEGKTAIDVCEHMDIPFIRVFGDKIHEQTIRNEVIQRTIKGIRELCIYASDKNVKVLLEVHGDFNTIENVMDVANELKDRPEFGMFMNVMEIESIKSVCVQIKKDFRSIDILVNAVGGNMKDATTYPIPYLSLIYLRMRCKRFWS